MVQICKKGRAKCHDPAQASQTICYLLEHKLLKMDMVNIEEMRSEHLTEVLRLVKELAEYEREPNAVEIEVSVLEKALQEDKTIFGWVAIKKGHVVGMALCYLRFSTWKGYCTYLEDLVVQADHRNMGIGKELLRAVIDHAKQMGYHYVRWQVLDWNQDAIAFYEGMGAKVEPGWLNVSYYMS